MAKVSPPKYYIAIYYKTHNILLKSVTPFHSFFSFIQILSGICSCSRYKLTDNLEQQPTGVLEEGIPYQEYGKRGGTNNRSQLKNF